LTHQAQIAWRGPARGNVKTDERLWRSSDERGILRILVGL